jgi:sulfur relay protein TusB/DsrH
MKILHIIRNPDDETPLEIARIQSEENEVAVLLLHDAVYAIPEVQFKVYACTADAEARGVSRHEIVDYNKIVEMLFEYDKVVSW